jgi:hypothetical protein
MHPLLYGLCSAYDELMTHGTSGGVFRGSALRVRQDACAAVFDRPVWGRFHQAIFIVRHVFPDSSIKHLAICAEDRLRLLGRPRQGTFASP